jgi:hypothetical protein
MTNLILGQWWVQTPCTILGSRVVEGHSDDGPTYSVEIKYQYSTGGRNFTGDQYDFFVANSGGRAAKEAVINRFPAGKRTVCFVDPSDPKQAVLHRGLSWNVLSALFPFLAICIFIPLWLAWSRKPHHGTDVERS